MVEIKNNCGSFFIDSQGVLVDFCCAEDNIVTENVWRCLDIPEGVRVIPEGTFRWCHVQQRLIFPKSLRAISTGDGCAFANSTLPHVELPETLVELGDFAFGHSSMRSVRIPRGLKSEYARQFKESSIGTLYLPKEFCADDSFRGFREKYDGGKEQYGYIRSMLVNNVEIGEIVFE